MKRYLAFRLGRGVVAVLRDVSGVFGERRGKDVAARSVGYEIELVGEGRSRGGAKRRYAGIVDRACRRRVRL